MNNIGSLKGKTVLFLQGPMGDFFQRLDTLFTQEGAKTYKIGFNAGDSFYSNKKNYIAYRDTREQYRFFIQTFLKEKKIDKIFLFGDCRFYQSISISVAKELSVEVFVFEEGYIRPNYITMERYGVNDYSHISRESDFYKTLPLIKVKKAKNVHFSQFKMVKSATLYYLISNIFTNRYPHYIHHREFSSVKEFFYALRSISRKFLYKWSERGYKELIEGELSGKYFFVPLQTYNDFQILEHSPYKSVEKFIIEVLESFAFNTKDMKIIFKHHPVDRGRKNYKDFIMDQASLYGIDERVIVLYDTYLPSLLKHAKGTVTINSTVGLSSLYHNTPTLTLGSAIYDIEGLTSKGISLDEFWSQQHEPDMELLEKFRGYIIKNTQLNGSFYGDLPTFTFE
jgi:capsular polysaccharide export protein